MKRTMIAMTTAMRKPELCVREGRVWKSLSVAGNGFVLFAGFSVSARLPGVGGLWVVCSIRLLIAFQILFDALFGVADGVRQFHLRKIVEIETLNITLVSAGDGFLRLYHFQIVGYPGGEAILRLRESLFRQFHGTASHIDLLRRGIQVEQRGAHLVVDSAGQVPELRPRLLQLCVGFKNVAVNAIACEDGNVNPSGDLPRPVRLGGCHSDVAEIRINLRRGITASG